VSRYSRICPEHGGKSEERVEGLFCLAGQHTIRRFAVLDEKSGRVVDSQPEDDVEDPNQKRGRKHMPFDTPKPKTEKLGRHKLQGHGETLWLRHVVKGHGDHRITWQQIGKSDERRSGTVAVFTTAADAGDRLKSELSAATKRGWEEVPIVTGRMQIREVPAPGSLASQKRGR
jgi:hypothetical protein